jgi:release factor glutamine methyltransferase
MTVRQWLLWAEQQLRDAGVPEPRLDAELLLAHALRADRSWLIAHADDPLPEIASLDEMLVRRRAREPLAYILGYREFWGRRFMVGPGVLVPRQETECLVETALEVIPADRPVSVLDFGTGSGCIGITLQLERPEWRLDATDVSPTALHWARLNAETLGAPIRLRRVEQVASLPPSSFDWIVTNPPYVALGEALQPEVTDWEPHEALFAGPTGYEFFEFLASTSHSVLRPGGGLLTEIGAGQEEGVITRFEAHGWTHAASRSDLSGFTRVLGFKRPTAAP